MAKGEFGFGFDFDMELNIPLDFFNVTYANGKKVRYEKQISGEWIPNTRYNRKGKIFLNCSVCHYGDCGDVMCFTSSIPKFCPNCGAKMSFGKGGGS